MSDARRLVDKLWSYCTVLRDDGLNTIEYVEQLTYLLFLKMAHERATRKLAPEQIVPEESPGSVCSTPTATTSRSPTGTSSSSSASGPGLSASSFARRRTRSPTRPS